MDRRKLIVVCLSIIAWHGAMSASACAFVERFDTVVVCPTNYQEAIVPWLQYRRQQGHEIAVLPSSVDPAVIRGEILRLAADHPIRSVVLIGDEGPTDVDRFDERLAREDFFVPTFMMEATVNVHFGSTPEFASDLGYADLDNDRIPDLSIGRIPVDSPTELRELTERIVRYEQTVRTDYASRRVNILAEPGNFGALADSILEMTARRFIGQGVPTAYDIDTTFANLSSPYCPDPRQLASTTLERINEGALFWVYIGHGQTWYLNPLRHKGRWYPLLDTDNISDLACQSLPPIAVFFCCNTGAYDIDHDSLAEELVTEPGGPIASFCASRVSMPFAMTVMADALLKEKFAGTAETLGELILLAKQQSANLPGEDDPRRWMYQLAQLFSPTRDVLDEELLENVALFNLLGDPLLRLRRPNNLELITETRAEAGTEITVRGMLPEPGRLTLELVYRRDRLPPHRAATSLDSSDESAWSQMQSGYERANNRTCRYLIVDHPAGQFEETLRVPSYAKGACHVRAFFHSASGEAIGARDLFVQAATSRHSMSRRPESQLDQR